MKIESFMKKLKMGYQKCWNTKYRKFATQIPTIRNNSEKRGHFGSFFGRRVDVYKGEGSGSCGRMLTEGRGRKPDFLVDVINGWPLNNAMVKR